MKMMHILGLSDGFSPIMNQIHLFHDTVMVIVLFIISLVLFVFASIVSSPLYSREKKSNETLELIWTIFPCLVLGFLAAPSLFILYLSDEIENPSMTVKVIGHQWYWSYEFDEGVSEGFDSYMLPTEEMWKGGFRLLEVDKRCFIPSHMEVRVLVTSGDVIHSWTVPYLGVKADAIPGRLNQISLLSARSGVVYGQCSEICGTNHSFMPICLEIIPEDVFLGKLKA
nr:cytochrome c oxidase subunit 2 [Quadraceps punctatus]